MTRPRPAGPRLRALIAALPLVALALLAPLLVAAPAHADDPRWAVQPGGAGGPDGRVAFEYADIRPGSTISDIVSISNLSAGPVLFNVYAADAVNDPESGAFTLTAGPGDSTGLGSWVAVSADAEVGCPDGGDAGGYLCQIEDGVVHIRLDANTRSDIPFRIAVPANATPGDHSAGIVAAIRQPAGEDQAVTVEQRVGARIHLRIAGGLTPSVGVTGLVAGFSPDGPLTGTVTVDYAITNDGNTRLGTGQRIAVTGPFGIPLGTVELDAVEDLLPGQSAQMHAELPGIAALFLTTATVELAPQTADGDAMTLAAGSAIAWAIPWLLLLVIAVAVAAVWLALRWRRRHGERLALTIAQAEERAREAALATVKETR